MTSLAEHLLSLFPFYLNIFGFLRSSGEYDFYLELSCKLWADHRDTLSKVASKGLYQTSWSCSVSPRYNLSGYWVFPQENAQEPGQCREEHWAPWKGKRLRVNGIWTSLFRIKDMDEIEDPGLPRNRGQGSTWFWVRIFTTIVLGYAGGKITELLRSFKMAHFNIWVCWVCPLSSMRSQSRQ